MSSEEKDSNTDQKQNMKRELTKKWAVYYGNRRTKLRQGETKLKPKLGTLDIDIDMKTWAKPELDQRKTESDEGTQTDKDTRMTHTDKIHMGGDQGK